MDIRNENDKEIIGCEVDEQRLCSLFIKENDIVLELGARYGAVSCTINANIRNKENQVVVEPDSRVWDALERNKRVNNCKFNIIKGFISKKKLSLTHLDSYDGYASTAIEDNNSNIPSFTLEEIKQKYNLEFNVLVADCEGFLETFFDENPTFYDNLRLVIFEADYPDRCNYDKVNRNLTDKGFKCIIGGFQNVWSRDIVM